MLILSEANRVKNEELQLRSEVAGRRDARAFQVVLGLFRHVARVTRIGFAEYRIEYVADDRERRHLAHRVDERGGGIGLQQHVRLVDLLESTNRGPVEPDS